MKEARNSFWGSAILLLRPQQWLKNAFVFAPLFFGGHLADAFCWVSGIAAFAAFCFAASSIYCLNDIMDVESDRLHPLKRKRPIASGRLSKAEGYGVAAVCLAASVLLATLWGMAWGNFSLLWIVALYLAMNGAYSLGLKNAALVDVFVIALGFVLRVLAGGMIAGIRLSQWIVLLTFLLALFLALAKRRDDVVMLRRTGLKMRGNIGHYSLRFIDLAIAIVASVTMVCYIMYSVSEEVVGRVQVPYLYLTSIFVLAGILRYLQLAIVYERTGSPTRVLMKDRFMQCCIAAWIVAFVFILYW